MCAKLYRLSRRILWLTIFFFALGWYGWAKLEASVGIPQQFRLIQGRISSFQPKLPLAVQLAPGAEKIVQLQRGKELTINPLETGEGQFDLSLFGVIPLKNRVVSVVPELRVIPGGESIGVMLASQGLIISQLAKVRTPDGQYLSPGAECGLLPGDLLLSIDDTLINSPGDVEEALRRCKNGVVSMKVIRSGETRILQARPVETEDERGRRYLRLGVYLEDTAAGVGTLSFYQPVSGRYAALGHMITDSRTGQEARITDGRIVPALVAGIRPGIKGRPGEKIGLFQDRAPSLGVISKNSSIGIFGRLDRFPGHQRVPIPVALAHEVEVGPAHILTVVEHDSVEPFEIEIIKVNQQSAPNVKGMVIKVTDPRLLEITGGIVQGMSGSPIIQKGKLVGVVTHVFVNDPTRGYGVFAEWMAYEAGMFAELQGKEEPAA